MAGSGEDVPVVEITPTTVAVGLLLALVVVGLVVYARRWDGRVRASIVAQQADIARIDEFTQFTGLGGFAVVMMVVSNIIAFFAFTVTAGALQQGIALLGGIAASVFWGVFAIIGRRRTYRVYREAPPPERAEPRL